MGGMPSARGLEWKGSGDSRARFDKGYEEIPKVPYCEDCAKEFKLPKRLFENDDRPCGFCGEKKPIVGSVFQDTAEKLQKEKSPHEMLN